MEKISINDWLTLQTRKDITYIRRSLEHESVNYAIFADLFIALVAFCLDHLFWTVDANTGAVEKVAPSAFWIITSVLLFIIPAIIFIYNYCKRVRIRSDNKMSLPVDYLIDLFDNEICYNVITADSMRDHLKDSNEQEEIKKLYFIEAVYYANKAITQLYYFDNQKSKAIYTSCNHDGVSNVRFCNVCEIIKKIYDDLINEAKQNEEYKEYLCENKQYMQNFNQMCVSMSGIEGLDKLENQKISLICPNN